MSKQNKTTIDITKYIDEGGVRCPYCGADQIEGGSVEIEEGTAQQKVGCLSCDRHWTDIYHLVGVCDSNHDLHEPPEAPHPALAALDALRAILPYAENEAAGLREAARRDNDERCAAEAVRAEMAIWAARSAIGTIDPADKHLQTPEGGA